MKRQVSLAATAAGGGMLAAAFLPAVAAFADTTDEAASGPTDAAFSLNGLTFDPGADGYSDITPLFENAPLLSIGGGSVSLGGPPIALATQDLTVYDEGAAIGTVGTEVNASNILGIESAQFTVSSVDAVDASELEDALTGSSSIDFSGAGFTASDLASDLDAATDLDFTGDVTATDITDALDTGYLDGSGVAASDVADAVSGIGADDAAVLPDVGTVYSITDLGFGIHNVYTAIPAETDSGSTEITDTLVTPLGNFDLSTMFDATAPMDPTDTFAGLDPSAQPSLFGGLLGGLFGGSGGSGGDAGGGSQDTPTSAAAGDGSGGGAGAGDGASGGDALSDNAFSLNGFAFDPGSDGWTEITPLFGDAPLLKQAVGLFSFAGLDIPLAEQSFDVYDDTGVGSDELGSVDTYVNSANILGIEATQFTINDVTPNIETSVVADTLADSNLDFSTADFDAQQLATALDDGGLNFGAAPFGDGKSAGTPVQDALDASGFDLGSSDITTGDIKDVFNSDAFTDIVDEQAADLPEEGSIYSVTDFGFGFKNVYVAVPDEDGDAAAQIQDTFVTPWGTIDLSTPYDAVAAIQPGNAFEGLDTTGGGLFGGLFGGSGGGSDSGSPAAAAAGDPGSGDAGADSGLSDHAFTIAGTTFDPGSDGWDSVSALFGVAPLMEIGGANVLGNPTATQELDVYNDAGDQVGTVGTAVHTSNIAGINTTQFTVNSVDAVDASELEDALTGSSIDFSGADFTAGDLASFLDGSTELDFTGDITASDVTDALTDSYLDGSGVTAGDIASAVSGIGADDAAALPDVDSTYSVTNIGLGFYNVYSAIPAETDSGSPEITDTLVTPFGNIDLSTPFNALEALNPGDAVAGVDDTSGGGLFGGLFDGLFSGLFGGSGDSGSDVVTDASATQIADALTASSTDFGGYDSVGVDDIAGALAASESADDLGGDVTASEVTSALSAENVDISGATAFDASDIADALNGADVADEGGSLFGDLFAGIF